MISYDNTKEINRFAVKKDFRFFELKIPRGKPRAGSSPASGTILKSMVVGGYGEKRDFTLTFPKFLNVLGRIWAEF